MKNYFLIFLLCIFQLSAIQKFNRLLHPDMMVEVIRQLIKPCQSINEIQSQDIRNQIKSLMLIYKRNKQDLNRNLVEGVIEEQKKECLCHLNDYLMTKAKPVQDYFDYLDDKKTNYYAEFDILNNGLSGTNCVGESIVLLAVQNQDLETTRLLLENGAPLNPETTIDNSEPFLYLCRKFNDFPGTLNYQFLDLLLRHKPQLVTSAPPQEDESDEDVLPPLASLALWDKNYPATQAVVEYIVKQYADDSSRKAHLLGEALDIITADDDGAEPGFPRRTIKLLIDNGALILPSFWASAPADCIDYFLAKGKDTICKQDQGHNPLSSAIEFRKPLHIVERILDMYENPQHALEDIFKVTREGIDVLRVTPDEVSDKYFFNIFTLMKKKGMNFNQQFGSQPFYKLLLERGQFRLLESLIDQNIIDISYTDNHGWPLLFHAVVIRNQFTNTTEADALIVQLLEKYKADVNQRVGHATPLGLAVMHAWKTDLIEILLKHGANPQALQEAHLVPNHTLFLKSLGSFDHQLKNDLPSLLIKYGAYQPDPLYKNINADDLQELKDAQWAMPASYPKPHDDALLDNIIPGLSLKRKAQDQGKSPKKYKNGNNN